MLCDLLYHKYHTWSCRIIIMFINVGEGVDLGVLHSSSNRSRISSNFVTIVTSVLSLIVFISSFVSPAIVTSPNKIRCMLSLNVVGLNLTTCHFNWLGRPRMRAFDSSCCCCQPTPALLVGGVRFSRVGFASQLLSPCG